MAEGKNDQVKIHTNSRGEKYAVMERFNQLAPILDAIKRDLWDLADYKPDYTRDDSRLPVKITWRIEDEMEGRG